MRETVLLINFQDEKQLRDLKMILFTLKNSNEEGRKERVFATNRFPCGIEGYGSCAGVL